MEGWRDVVHCFPCSVLFKVALSFQNNVDEAVEKSRELVSYWHDLGYRRLEALR